MGNFENNLKSARISRGLKQKDFEEIGLSGNTISNYESGVSRPDINILLKLSKFLGVSTDFLLGSPTHLNHVNEPQAEYTKTPDKDVIIQQLREENNRLKDRIIELQGDLIQQNKTSQKTG